MSILSTSRKRFMGASSGAHVALLTLLCAPLLIGLLVWQQYNVALIVAGMIAMGVVALMFAQPEATTVVVVFILYANLTVVAIYSFGVPSALAASVVLLLGLPLLQYLFVRRQAIVVNRIVFLMVAYLGILLTSAALSGNAAASMGRIRDFALEGFVLYLLIINTVRTPTVLRLSIWALIMAGVLMGGISLYQEVTGVYDNDFGGLSVVNEATMNTGQVDGFGNEISRGRMAGPVGEKNRYAQIMIVLLPLALSRLWAERAWGLRLLGALSCIPILGGALLTFSRGAGVALVIVVLVMLAMRLVKWWQLLLIIALGYLFISLAVPDYLYRMTTTADVAELATGNADEAGGSVQGRATENLGTLYTFLDHPILGVGPGQTSSYAMEYGNEVGFRKLTSERRAHNMYLEELSDTGIIGFGLFAAILWITLSQLLRLRQHWLADPAKAYTLAGLFLGLVAYMGSAFFLHLSYVRYYWLILALAAAAYEVWKIETPKQLPPAQQLAQPPNPAPRVKQPIDWKQPVKS